MKKQLFFLGIILQFFVLRAQSQTFVYSMEGEVVLLEQNDTIQYVHFAPDAGSKAMETVLTNLETLASRIDMVTPEIYRYDLNYSDRKHHTFTCPLVYSFTTENQ